MGKKALLVYDEKKEKWMEDVSVILEQMGYEADHCDSSSEEGKKKVNCAAENDIVVSFELAGFEWGTQTGSFLYNILPCKSIHFFRQQGKETERILQGRKFSIALYLYALGVEEEEERALRLMYDNVPWLRGLLNESKAELERALKEVEEDIA